MGLTNLRRFSTHISRDTRKALYRTLFLPHLDHHCVVWLARGTNIGKKLELIQNYTMRLILSKKSHTVPLVSLKEETMLDNLKQRREIFQLMQLHRDEYKQGPE